MSEYVNSIGFAVADMIFLDLGHLMNGNTRLIYSIAMTPSTLKAFHETAGRILENIEKHASELKKAN